MKTIDFGKEREIHLLMETLHKFSQLTARHVAAMREEVERIVSLVGASDETPADSVLPGSPYALYQEHHHPRSAKKHGLRDKQQE